MFGTRFTSIYLAALVAGCGPDTASNVDGPDLPDPLWVGNHLEFATTQIETAICGGTLAYLDNYFGELKRRFGSPADLHYRYFYIADDDVKDLPCPDSFIGCESESLSSIYVRDLIVEHELVHAAIPSRGNPILEEGAAMVWGDDWFLQSEETALTEALQSITPRLPSKYYGIAGHFVAFLSTQFGDFSDFTQFAAETTPGGGADELEAASNLIYAVPFSDLVDAHAEFLSDIGYCDPFRYRDASISCALAEPVQCNRREVGDAYELGFEFSVDLRCDSDDAIGPKGVDEIETGGVGARWVSRSFDAPVSGGYVVSIVPQDLGAPASLLAGQGDLYIESCGGGCQHFQELLQIGPDPMIISLQEGPHRIRIRQFSQNPEEAIEQFSVQIVATTQSADVGCG